MSGSSSVAAMKKVVQQLRLEAGLNRVKVSGRGRAVGPGGRAGRHAAPPAGLWAAGEEGARPSAARGLFPAPAVSATTSVSLFSPRTYSQSSPCEHTRVRSGSPRPRSNK